MQFCRGIGRKLAIPVLVFSVLGWILYVIAFASFNNTDNFYNDYRRNGTRTYAPCPDGRPNVTQDPSLPAQRASLLWFPHWCVLIVGPFVYICTVLHLIVGRFFTGIFTKFLTAVYLGAGGAVAYDWGVKLFSTTRSGFMYQFCFTSDYAWISEQYWGLWPLLEFVGVLGALFFMTLFMMMWPLFSERYAEYYEEVEEYEEDPADKDDQEEQAV